MTDREKYLRCMLRQHYPRLNVIDQLPDWALYMAVLAAAICHATWNALVKNSSDQLLALTGLRVVGLPIAIALLVYTPWPDADITPYLIGNLLFTFGYYFCLLNAYRVGEFSSVYPISRGIAPLVVLGVAYLYGIDEPALAATLATLLVSTGVAILAFQRQLETAAMLYALATGVMIAGYTFLAGAGVRHSNAALAYLAWSELLTAIGLIAFTAQRRRGRVIQYLSHNRLQVIASGILSITGFGIVLTVFQTLPLGPVTAVRESSVLFAGLIGVVFLKESWSVGKGVALLLVSTGISVIAFA